MNIFRNTAIAWVLLALVCNVLPAASQSLPTKGANQLSAIAPNNTTGVVVKATPGVITGIQVGGIGSAPAYLKLYDKATAPTGSDTPVKRILIPAAATAANGQMIAIDAPVGIKFAAGISYRVTTGIADNDTTAPAASTFLINIDYN